MTRWQDAQPESNQSATISHQTLSSGGHDAPRQIDIELKQVTEQFGAELGALFYFDPLDPETAGIQLMTQYSREPGMILNTDTLQNLDETPVQDVLSDKNILLQNHVSRDSPGQFRKLRELLTFESCLGIPIHLDGDVQHVLFFFHRKPLMFSDYFPEQARIIGILFSALLREQRVDSRLRAESQRLLNGDIAVWYGHDIVNKLMGLESYLVSMAQPSQAEPTLFDAATLLGQDELHNVKEYVADLSATIRAFHSLSYVKPHAEPLDVNEMVETAKSLLRPLARKSSVRLDIHLDKKMPLIQGQRIALQQLLLNVWLNAIQWTELKAARFNWTGSKLVETRTQFDEARKVIKITVQDRGPGIHRHLWERIFVAGVSTRGGSGLGLPIARTFARSIGGTVQVESSAIPCGTTFVIELPVA